MNTNRGVQLRIANSLWADLDVEFKKSFMKTNTKYNNAEISNLELSDPISLKLINEWIGEKTEGKIKNIVNTSDLDAILFLVNAVYFQGYWSVGFNKKDTQEGNFNLLDGNIKKVPMMYTQSDKYSYYQGEEFQAVELPYRDEKVSLYLFLPDRESNLQEFYKKLNRDNWETWIPEFRKELVRVTLPRFNLEYDILLNAVLKSIGMGIAFTPQANFSKMCKGKAWVDFVRHKSFIDVNEEGTEAAAATVVKMKKGAIKVLSFDRPFFFAIRDKITGVLLFMGSVLEPVDINNS